MDQVVAGVAIVLAALAIVFAHPEHLREMRLRPAAKKVRTRDDGRR